MRDGPGNHALSLINRNNIKYRDYMQTLLTEGVRVHLISMQTVDDLQMQIMGQLEELMQAEREEGAAPMSEEEAQTLLGGIFFTVDTCLLGYHDPMYALAALQTGSISEMYQSGLKHLLCHYGETVSLLVRARKCATPQARKLEEETITQIRQYLDGYDPYRAAAFTPEKYSYRLANETWANHSGIFATKYYLKYLLRENRFLQYFLPEECDSLLAVSETDNLFEAVARVALGRSILGKMTGTLNLSQKDQDQLMQRLSRRSSEEVRDLMCISAEDLIRDLGMTDEDEVVYLKWYARNFATDLIRAQRQDRLERLFVVTDFV